MDFNVIINALQNLQSLGLGFLLGAQQAQTQGFSNDVHIKEIDRVKAIRRLGLHESQSDDSINEEVEVTTEKHNNTSFIAALNVA